jgi:hypothetical protein
VLERGSHAGVSRGRLIGVREGFARLSRALSFYPAPRTKEPDHRWHFKLHPSLFFVVGRVRYSELCGNKEVPWPTKSRLRN